MKEIETKWKKYWQENNFYRWNIGEQKDNTFVVDTPPPTISGQLHMGNVLGYCHLDFIARFQRMRGKNVFFPIGFDDNGLPTERFVEKKHKIKAVNVNKQEFISLCQKVSEEEKEKFRNIFQTLGLSIDWSLEYSTNSNFVRQISQMSFLDLLQKNYIYRANQPVMWDPVDQTAIAQTEIEDHEKSSHMNYIKFQTETKQEIIIATTRPELLPACVCIFVHPDDERYKSLIGQNAVVPLFNQLVPIYSDEDVEQDKGTGIVMCCTFGDLADVNWWKKYELPTRIILDKNGRIKPIKDLENNDTFNDLIGLNVKVARSNVIEFLKDQDLLEKQDEITHAVKCAERSKAPLEILITPQWFIKTLDYKDDMLGLSAKLNWFPRHMKIRMDTWIQNLNQDWCISRQRFSGVPFPVWYSRRQGEEGKVLLPNIDQLPVDPNIDLPEGYSKDEIVADQDIMDTWATSAVTPQINSHGISESFYVDDLRHKKLFPADLRLQGHEIIRVWAFGTVLKAHLHQNTLPWSNIMINGWCLAEDRTKMSKSKGNVINPISLCEKYSADIIRYWASTPKLGADVAFSEDAMLNGKRLVNKIWNAFKFSKMHFDKLIKNEVNDINQLLDKGQIYCTMDLWILHHTYELVKNVTNFLNKFDYANAREIIEHFFWQNFCDCYLEIIKSRIYNDNGNDDKGQKSAVLTLYHVFNVLIRLFAPFIPYITAEISDQLGKSIHSQNTWPSYIGVDFSDHADLFIKVLKLTHKMKSEKQLSIKSPIEKIKIYGENIFPEDALQDLKNVTSAKEIVFDNTSNKAKDILITF